MLGILLFQPHSSVCIITIIVSLCIASSTQVFIKSNRRASHQLCRIANCWFTHLVPDCKKTGQHFAFPVDIRYVVDGLFTFVRPHSRQTRGTTCLGYFNTRQNRSFAARAGGEVGQGIEQVSVEPSSLSFVIRLNELVASAFQHSSHSLHNR